MSDWVALGGVALWVGALADGSLSRLRARWRIQDEDGIREPAEVTVGFAKASIFTVRGAPRFAFSWVAILQGCLGLSIMASALQGPTTQEAALGLAVVAGAAAAAGFLMSRRATKAWFAWSRLNLLAAGWLLSGLCFGLAASMG